LNRFLPQRVVAKNQRRHCFDDGHRSWKNAWIVASASGKLGWLF
jgi:hypothetical protein